MLTDQVEAVWFRDLTTAIASGRRSLDDARRSDTRDLTDLYHGAVYAMALEAIEQGYKKKSTKAKIKAALMVINFCKWIIDESSCGFRRAPVTRVSAGGVNLTKTWSQLAQGGNLYRRLRGGERYSWLTDDALIFLGARPLPIGKKKARLTWDPYTPDRYAVEQDFRDPSTAEAVAMFFQLRDSEGANLAQFRRGFIQWTREFVRVINEKGDDITAEYLGRDDAGVPLGPESITDEGLINPYKDLFDIPVGVMRSSERDMGEFYGAGAVDLLTLTNQANLMRTELRLTQKMQGFGQLVLINAAEGTRDKIPVGMESPLLVTSRQDLPGDAKFINPNAPMADSRANINQFIQETAQRWGLNGQDFISSEHRLPAPPSGKSKQIDNLRMAEKTIEIQDLNLPIYIDMVVKSLIIARTWQKAGWDFPGVVDLEKVPLDYYKIEVEVDFPERPNLDTLEDLQVMQGKAKVGIVCWADEFMKDHPEIETREAAEAKMLENQASNDRVTRAAMMAAAQAAMTAGIVQPDGGPLPPGAGPTEPTLDGKPPAAAPKPGEPPAKSGAPPAPAKKPAPAK